MNTFSSNTQDFSFIDPTSQAIASLAKLTNKTPHETFAEVYQIYQEAEKSRSLTNVGLDTHIDTETCTYIFKPNRNLASRFALHFAFYLKVVPEKKREKKAIYEDLQIGTRYLSELSSAAKRESWNGRSEYSILQNMQEQIYAKAKREGKLCYSNDGTFMAYNTCLCDSEYNEIFACFESDDETGKMKYIGVCTAGGGFLGKKIVRAFSSLPQRASFIQRKEDVIFDNDKPLFVDAEHILLDRIHRLPLEFLRLHFSSSSEATEIIDRLESTCLEDADVLFKRLRDIASVDEKIYDSMNCALSNMIQKAVKSLRWNYRLAIPCYYPKWDNMSFLLPMDFLRTGSPQAALVVQLVESGNYIGHTLLSMEQAYMNARLISSQESSWLTA